MPYPCGWFTNVLKPSFPVWFFVADCFPAIVTVTDQIDLPVVQLLFPFCLSWETYNHRTVEEGKDHLPLRWQSKGCIHSLLHCHVTHGLISRKPGFIPFSLQVQFKALSLSPADYCVNILFPLWERFICLQQAWCCDQNPSSLLVNQAWIWVFVCWLFLLISSSFPTTWMIEENTALLWIP